MVLTRVVVPSTLSGATRLANGRFQFQGMGEAGLTCIIQAHTNLNTTNWLTIDIAPADGAGLFQFLDPHRATASPTFLPRRPAMNALSSLNLANLICAAPGLGEQESAIATVATDGVALAATQGLNQKLEEKSWQ